MTDLERVELVLRRARDIISKPGYYHSTHALNMLHACTVIIEELAKESIMLAESRKATDNVDQTNN